VVKNHFKLIKNIELLNNFRIGDLLQVVRFTEEDLKELQRRVLQKKIDELFDEPSTYEDEEDE
jgi:hypothetical protein